MEDFTFLVPKKKKKIYPQICLYELKSSNLDVYMLGSKSFLLQIMLCIMCCSSVNDSFTSIEKNPLNCSKQKFFSAAVELCHC